MEVQIVGTHGTPWAIADVRRREHGFAWDLLVRLDRAFNGKGNRPINRMTGNRRDPEDQ